VLHRIEIIGEAARGVGDKVRTAHPEVPWRVITDMRNRVSRGYFDIDLDVVWNTGRAACRNSRNPSPGSLPGLTRNQKTHAEQPSGSALADGDIAPVDLTRTDRLCADGLPGEFVQEPPLGTADASDFAIAEPPGANRPGGVGPPSPDGGPAEHADALTLPP
jgi:hypothetical protein